MIINKKYITTVDKEEEYVGYYVSDILSLNHLKEKVDISVLRCYNNDAIFPVLMNYNIIITMVNNQKVIKKYNTRESRDLAIEEFK